MKFQRIKAHKVVIVKVPILKSITHNTLNINLFQLLKHIWHVVGCHLGAFVCDNRAEVDKVAYSLAVITCSFTGFCRDLSGFGNNFQSTIRSKVKDKTLFLYLTANSGRCLNTEDSLHITRSSGTERTGKHKNCCPRLYTHTRSQTTTRKSDCVGIFRLIAYSLIYEFKSIISFLILITFTRHIYHLELTEYSMRL